MVWRNSYLYQWEKCETDLAKICKTQCWIKLSYFMDWWQRKGKPWYIGKNLTNRKNLDLQVCNDTEKWKNICSTKKIYWIWINIPSLVKNSDRDWENKCYILPHLSCNCAKCKACIQTINWECCDDYFKIIDIIMCIKYY